MSDRGRDIPESIRKLVVERDNSCCRLCGQHQDHPHLHHIVYRSQLGRHTVDNLISLCFKCHMDRAHGAHAHKWREIFVELTQNPAVTGFALWRWRHP